MNQNQNQKHDSLGDQAIQPPSQQYAFSGKIIDTAKGIRLELHIWAESSERLRQELLRTYIGILTDCRNNGIIIAPVSQSGNGVKE
ncbi:MAG TPA: hypothetical protein VFJ05_06980 [Nitrososphaeraceae archaeon]|nr:hypothetical protein [Nitrososphaeraceae archaeon]